MKVEASFSIGDRVKIKDGELLHWRKHRTGTVTGYGRIHQDCVMMLPDGLKTKSTIYAGFLEKECLQA